MMGISQTQPQAKPSQTSPRKRAFQFVYVSGRGATQEPGRFSAIFARVKGETEVALAELRKKYPLLHASSVRPAAVDASAHQAILPYIPTQPFAYRMLGPVLLKPVQLGLPSLHSPTQPLGRFLAEMAIGKHAVGPAQDIAMIGEFPIYENSAFRRLAGLDPK
ncbi:hypothetical protein RRF57_009440 [Xylaria bambusicola]|uniref:Uncharacterized protein n=1 Tax=Xylaria bambusicola TaxID=326684 RepID=A0AAN7ZBY9_9PEZI